MEEDTAVGHRLLAKHKMFGPAGFQDGCYCGHCRPLQNLPTPSWEQAEEDDVIKVTIEDTKTGETQVLVPVQDTPKSGSTPATLTGFSYPRMFHYTALVDGSHKVIDREVTVPVTLKNFGQTFGPERRRFRMTPAQQAAGVSREQALAEWIEEHSKPIAKPTGS